MLRQLTAVLIVLCSLAAFANAAATDGGLRSASRALHHDRNILAKPRADALSQADRAERDEGLEIRQRFSSLGDLRVLRVAKGESVPDAIARLKATGRYEYVEPDYVMQADATVPNDTYFYTQWGLSNTGQLTGSIPGRDINATLGWDVIHDAPNVIVGLIDSGIRTDHLDLTPNLWQNPAPTFGDINGMSSMEGVRGVDLNDQTGHGSHVAGIICARGNNGLNVSGVAWRAQLMVLRNMNDEGNAYTSDSIACLNYAIAHGAKVINCSFGGTSYSSAFYTALKAARDAGVIVVCSAGNTGTDNEVAPHYPSNYLLDNIVAVGNSDASDLRASSSCYGARVDLFAPGTSIRSTYNNSSTGMATAGGTSMATPFVTGTIALLREQYPNDSYRDIINRLLRGAERVAELRDYALTGARLDLYGALMADPLPFNLNADHAATVTGTTFSLRASSATSATTIPTPTGEPTHIGSRPLWWRWTAPATGKYILNTVGSAVDTGLDVYTGTITTGTPASSTLTRIASNDDDGTSKTSSVSFTVNAGTTCYFVASLARGAAGYTQLNFAKVVANDDFENAAPLGGVSAQVTLDNSTASLQANEPKILDRAGLGSVWYKWTAPQSGRFQVSVYSFDFDPMLAIYTGSAIDQLTLVTANDDSADSSYINTDSLCTFQAVSGTTYYLKVQSRGTYLGTAVLSLVDSDWQFVTNSGIVTTSPAIAPDGTLYVGCGLADSRLVALNPDGTLKWSYATTSGMSIAPPAIGADGTIYQSTLDNEVLALTPTGTLKWKRSFASTPTGGIAIAADGTLYVQVFDGNLHALKPTDGTSKWTFATGTTTFASPVIAADGTIYQGSDVNRALYAINADGTQKWKYALDADTFSTPAIDAQGNIYFATYSNATLLSLTSAGTLRWSHIAATATNSLSSSPVLSADGKTVYIATSEGRLEAVNAASGVPVWAYQCADSILACTPAIDANGVIYVGAYDGKLYAITANGALRRIWATGSRIRSSPLIAGTSLYVGSYDFKLYAFDIGASAAGGSWPQARQNASRTGRAQATTLTASVYPASIYAALGNTTTLRAAATGDGPLTFQWYKDGQAITGATSARYVIASITAGDVGKYTVRVTGSQGTVTSAELPLSLPQADVTPRIANVSILSRSGSAAAPLTAGVVIGGGAAGSKLPLLMRASGPSLEKVLGVPGSLPDPVLRVLDAAANTIGYNAGWAGNPEIVRAGTAVYAFPFFSTTSLDAAVLQSLAPERYTVQVTGNAANSSGAALVEMYDTSTTFTSATPRIVNISARADVGGAAGILTAGFYISGSTPKRVLIRAIGPRLADLSVPGVLEDPILDVYRAGENAPFITCDNWDGTNNELISVTRNVWAFNLLAGSKDAALLLTLPAGGYTAVVRSAKENATGVALVEVYEAP
ncbi:S8 family serine peptidase [Opitutus sp. ER46]|uniref:S8 family serine peptidase n=1 Tax=Opitutus sp. ER46 TaxID=2161864 RepID=UPI000D30CFA5|nr:S8 family serine peptidase [Opitutus sp. ER46]PTY00525.1 hypothetical protein DB354_01410 [Opitutus sp. ER46]